MDFNPSVGFDGDIVENFVDDYVVEETFVPSDCMEVNRSQNVMFELLKQISANQKQILQQLKIQTEKISSMEAAQFNFQEEMRQTLKKLVLRTTSL